MRTEQRRRGSRLVIVKCASAVGVLILLASGALAQAATIAVSSPMPADGDAPDIVCTLREAIKAATSRRNYNGCILTGSSSVNTILLPFGTYKLTSTLPTVGSNIQIIGSGYARTTIDGNTQGGVLGAIVLSGTGIQLSDLALQNFRDSAVKVQAGSDTRITAVAFRANGNSNSSGSEIDNSGRTKVLSCSFQSPPPIRPFGSLIRSSGSGAEIIITQSTISGSHAFHGVLYNAAGSSMFLYNSTVGGNIDDASGVIHNEAGAVLGIGFSTIAFNFSSVARGSAISNDPGGSVTVSESMIFGPRTFTGTPTCVGAITSGGYNVFDASSPCAPLAEGDITTSTPGLDTNGDQPKPHGGVAPVYLPLAGSPLIAHVDASFCDTIDQRRVGRPLWPENCATGSVDIANAVLVVRNPGSLSTGDGNVLAQIQTIFGADRVSVFPDVFQGPATFPGVVVISGSVSDANIGTHFRNLGQGVVVLKQSLYDEMNMTNSSATSSEGTFSASSLRIFGTGDTFNSDHFTAIGSASGFTSGGYTTVNNDPAVTGSTAQFGWGAAGQFARTDGAIPAALNNLGIFHYEQGQTMFHSFVAPAPRIGFFANDATAGALSTAGKRLLQEAVIVGTHGDF